MFDLWGYFSYFRNWQIEIKHRGKGHNRQAHKNNYKQKIKKNRGRR